jgi:hypothetical protein
VVLSAKVVERKLNQNVLEAIYENPRTEKRREEKEKGTLGCGR